MRISDLTLLTSVASGDVFPAVHNGTTYKVPIKSLVNYLAFSPDSIRNISGQFTVSGDTIITGDLRVSGNTYLGGDSTDVVRVLGQFKQSGTSYLSGNAIITGSLDVSGGLLIGTGSGSSHRISGNVTVQGSGYFGNRVTVEKTLTAKENFTLNHNATIGTDSADIHAIYGQITFYHNISTQGNTSFVGSNNYFAGNNWINGSLTTTGGLVTRGNVSLNNSLANLTRVSGQLINHANAYFLQQLSVLGNSDLSGNVNVYGNTNLGDSAADLVTISGSQITRGNGVNLGSWTVGGATRLTGDMLLKGVGYVTNDLNVSSNLRMSGKSLFGNNPTDTASFIGDTIISRNLSVTGDVSLSGTLTVGTKIVDVGARWVKFSGLRRQVLSVGVNGTELAINLDSLAFKHQIQTGAYLAITGQSAANGFNGTFQVTRIAIDAGGFGKAVFCERGASIPAGTGALGDMFLDAYVPSGCSSDIQSILRVSAGKYIVRFQRDLANPYYIPMVFASIQEAATAYQPQACIGFDNGASSNTMPMSGKLNDFFVSTFVPSIGYVDTAWIWMKIIPM